MATALAAANPVPVVADAGGSVGEVGLVARAGTPSGRTLAGGLWPLSVGTAVCGNGAIEPPETCDDGGILPWDGCSAACRVETSQIFAGIALGGFDVSLQVSGVPINIITTPGQTADQVAQSLADAILMNPVLQMIGISARAAGSDLQTDGVVLDLQIDDPGLNPLVPVLSLPARLLLITLLTVLMIAISGGRRLKLWRTP